MRLLALLLYCGSLLAQIPAQDARNLNYPGTNTHFRPRQYRTLAEWQARKSMLRRQILFAAGLLPLPEKTPLNPHIFGRLEREGYTIEKVFLETLPGFYLGGNLYRPAGKEGKFPAVAKPHGHWNYGRLENQPLGSTPVLCANLARQGYVAFAYDMVGYNDTFQTPHRFKGKAEELWAFGPLGLQLWDSIRVIDFLESLPYVDKSRIAVTGASGGGTQTFLLDAVDDRVFCSAPVNMVSAIMQGGCVCENAPGLRIGTNNVDIAAMMAPRPMLVVSATGDWTRNVPKEEFPAIQKTYRLYGKGANVEVVQIDAPHNYNRQSREAVYRFFARRVLGRQDADKISEESTDIEQLRDMMVFWGRRLPANAVTYEELFRWWKQVARGQSEQIRAPEQMRARLQLALKTEWPAKVLSEVEGDNILLSRAGAGDRVPGLWFPGKGRPALVVHPEGAEAARGTQAAGELIKAGRPVLLIDAFQTGRAKVPHPARGDHFLTFNRSDDANRVQDILTALAFLHSQAGGEVELVGLDKAAVWTLFAAAVAPVPLKLSADLSSFHGTDEEFIEQFFVPAIQRAGGLPAALQLTAGMR